MNGIISSHSAYQRQSAVEAVAVPRAPAPREAAVSSVNLRAARVSSSGEARALAGEEAIVDRAKVERLRSAIEAGSLKFDAQLVAQRVIDRAE